MRVLLVHNDYGGFSGEEAAVNSIAQMLESHDHEITWFRRSSAEIGDSLVKKANALLSGIYSFDSRRQMNDLLDKSAIDLVQVQNLYPFISPSVLLACKEKRIPVVMRCPNYRLFCPNGLHLAHGKVCERCLGGKEWHCVLQNCGGDVFKSFGYAARNAFARFTRMITDNVTIFVVLSEFQKSRFIENGIPSERIAILPNIAPEVKISEHAPVGEMVSFVGRVSAEKGVDEFFHAAQKLPGLQFAIAGNAENLPPSLAKECPNLNLRGFLSGKPLDDFFNTSRLMVFPSKWYEGFPTVIAKAMAHGKPVIASRMGSIPEIVDDGVTGLLCNPGDADDLAEKIDYLWKQPDLCQKMGKAGLQKARKEYSKEKIYTQLMGIYEKAIHFDGI